jgi:hypothetical protein
MIVAFPGLPLYGQYRCSSDRRLRGERTIDGEVNRRAAARASSNDGRVFQLRAVLIYAIERAFG